MDTEATKAYYAGKKRADICSCDYCRNFMDEVKSAYPEAAEYLSSIGVDIALPYEVLLPIENDDGTMDYYAVDYFICGEPDGFEETKIGDISVQITEAYPRPDNYEGSYFVITLGTFRIRRRTDKYAFR